jgi:hypothetical protein
MNDVNINIIIIIIIIIIITHWLHRISLLVHLLHPTERQNEFNREKNIKYTYTHYIKMHTHAYLLMARWWQQQVWLQPSFHLIHLTHPIYICAYEHNCIHKHKHIAENVMNARAFMPMSIVCVCCDTAILKVELLFV